MNKLPTPAQPASTKHMHYDDESRRWCIGERELHCGDCFNLYPDKENSLPPIPVRIEHCSAGWYLISDYGILQPSKRRAKL